jgi:uncharacterized membrane protein
VPIPRYEREDTEFGRATGFYDATFAIAATLLVTTIDPGRRGWSSWSNFWDAVELPLFAYAISFVVITMYWWSNHQFVSGLRALSPRLIVGSLWMLAFVVLLPFSTRGIGEGLGSSEVTTVVYAMNVALVSTMEWVLYRVALRDKLFRVEASRTEVFTSTVCQLMPAAVFALSIPIAFASATTARWFWLSLVVLSPIAGRWATARNAQAASRAASGGSSTV